MTAILDRMRLHSITVQITGIVAVSVLLGMAFTIAIVIYLSGISLPSNTTRFLGARIVDGTRLVRSARSADEATAVLGALQRAGIRVQAVPLNELVTLSPDKRISLLSWPLTRRLESEPGIDILERSRYPAGPEHQIVVKLDDGEALVFDAAPGDELWRLILTPTALLLIIVMVFVLLLSVYAVRWIIAPLADVAEAALSFGRSPRDDQVISRRGPREITQVAD
ncbi:MAG: putative two component sensor histidine kinase, partial [Tardiphaga sp.]|nr:putative two component sensor histidine kinase [Tardiphaga sp.]